jgi:hypothetical protein
MAAEPLRAGTPCAWWLSRAPGRRDPGLRDLPPILDRLPEPLRTLFGRNFDRRSAFSLADCSAISFLYAFICLADCCRSRMSQRGPRGPRPRPSWPLRRYVGKELQPRRRASRERSGPRHRHNLRREPQGQRDLVLGRVRPCARGPQGRALRRGARRRGRAGASSASTAIVGARSLGNDFSRGAYGAPPRPALRHPGSATRRPGAPAGYAGRPATAPVLSWRRIPLP